MATVTYCHHSVVLCARYCPNAHWSWPAWVLLFEGPMGGVQLPGQRWTTLSEWLRCPPFDSLAFDWVMPLNLSIEKNNFFLHLGALLLPECATLVWFIQSELWIWTLNLTFQKLASLAIASLPVVRKAIHAAKELFDLSPACSKASIPSCEVHDLVSSVRSSSVYPGLLHTQQQRPLFEICQILSNAVCIHFTSFLCISLHFSVFLCISLHFSEFLCISLHFTFYIL